MIGGERKRAVLWADACVLGVVYTSADNFSATLHSYNPNAMSFLYGYTRAPRFHGVLIAFALGGWIGTGCAVETPPSTGAAEVESQPAPANDGVDPEAKLAEMGITLPTPPPPVANYVRAVRSGNLVFLSGHGPLQEV